MQLFDNRTSLFLLCFTIPLLFLPKINLVSLHEGETAGIRIDDLILLGIASMVFWAIPALKRRLSTIENTLFALTLFGIFSYMCNLILNELQWIHVKSNPLYSLRLIEYFVFFYVGIMASRFIDIQNLIKALVAWVFCLMVLQKLGLVGSVTISGYASENTNRIMGIASFPSEMGLILNILYAWLCFNDQHKAKRLSSDSLLFAIFFFFVLLTGNRISLMALIICFALKVWREMVRVSLLYRVPLISVGVFAIAAMSVLMIQTDSFLERSENLLTTKNFNAAYEAWQHIDITRTPIGQENEHGKNLEYDQSWWMRVHKWSYVLKIYLSHPECYLQGVGPGFAFSALDGGFLRILVEYGLIGSYLFYLLFRWIYQQSLALKMVVVVFLINMTTFDVYLAYKPMSLLFLISGYAFAISNSLEQTYENQSRMLHNC